MYCTLAAIMAVMSLPSTVYTKETSDNTQQRQVAPTKLIPFELDKSIGISIHSSLVKSNQKEVCLLNLSKIDFHLDTNSRLTTKLAVASTNGWTDLPAIVTYIIHLAVFDEKGKLLGTASASCKLYPSSIASARMAYGFHVSLDFGTSLNYDKAKYFVLAISEPEIKKRDATQLPRY